MDFDFHVEPSLLKPPTMRAAYSDRTAWLMAVMSYLAYVPFEAPPDMKRLRDLATTLAEEKDIDAIVSELNKLIRPGRGEEGKALLRTRLGEIGFRLLETYSVIIPPNTDTQAFIARIQFTPAAGDGDGDGNGDDDKEDMLVLCFRGTEPTKYADIKTDFDADMANVPSILDEPARVHNGFLEAFNSVRGEINEVLRKPEHVGLPVYVTGHSLGAALAIVATRYIANQSLGACYTFGGPRVSNRAFGDQIFTPIYRVVNGADAVTMAPPSGPCVAACIWIFKHLHDWFEVPLLDRLVKLLKKVDGYIHLGDVRFLSRVAPTYTDSGAPEFKGLVVRTRVPLRERFRFFKEHKIPGLRYFAAMFGDHDIKLYVKKLDYYARERAQRKRALNSRAPEPDTE